MAAAEELVELVDEWCGCWKKRQNQTKWPQPKVGKPQNITYLLVEDGGGPLQERDQLLGLRLRRLLVNCLGCRLRQVLRLDLPANESAVDRGRGQPADHRGSVLLQKVGRIVPVGLQL